MYKLSEYVNNLGLVWISLANRGFFNWMPDILYISIRYRILMKRPLDLKHPTTFNEKLQWLKLNDHKPQYTSMVDKHKAKKYCSSVIGEKYIIPTIGIWDHVDDINFDKLPNRFVLKCTHDSGSTIVVKDKESINTSKIKKRLKKALKKNFYYVGREWPYKMITPRIIAEEYIEDSDSGEAADYKFFVFNGVSKVMFVATERNSSHETKSDFFNMEFNHLDLTNGHPNSEKIINKPESFDLMRELSEKLGAGIPHCRVDFYEVDGRVYFGEITFYHWSGFVPFKPEKWDYIFGEWIELPKKENNMA